MYTQTNSAKGTKRALVERKEIKGEVKGLNPNKPRTINFLGVLTC